MEDLHARTLRQFDALVARHELFWRPNEPQIIPSKPFNFNFRIAPSFAKKPIQSASALGRSKDMHVFSDTDPDFFLCHIGTHTLILNKYCVVRPQLILHTSMFEPQSGHLNDSDLGAVWEVLRGLDEGEGKGKGSGSMVLYNCGVEAGSSLGHKHLQIFPRPGREELTFWPDVMDVDEKTNTVPSLPFRHAVKKISVSPSSAELLEVYETLKKCSKVDEAPAHNVVLVKDWMLVLPRTIGRIGKLNAGGNSFLGMVWVNSEEDLEMWKERGPMDLLCEFGVVEK